VHTAIEMLSMKSTTITNHTNNNNNNNNKSSSSNNNSSSSQDYQKKNLVISKIIEFVLRRKAHEDLVLPFDVEGKFTTKIPAPDPNASILISLEDFITYGFTRSLGEFQGQLADFRYMLPDKRSIHLRVFNDHFRLHWDYIDPRADPIGHIAADAPHWLDMANNAITTITRILQMLPQSGK
jgi:hypothetical protein